MTVRDHLIFPEGGEKLQRTCQCSPAVLWSCHFMVTLFLFLNPSKPFLELHANKWQGRQHFQHISPSDALYSFLWRCYEPVFVQLYLEGIALTRNIVISEWEGGQDWQVDAGRRSEASAGVRSCAVIQRASGNNGRNTHSPCQCCVFQLDKVGFKRCAGWLAPLLMLTSAPVPLRWCICAQHKHSVCWFKLFSIIYRHRLLVFTSP